MHVLFHDYFQTVGRTTLRVLVVHERPASTHAVAELVSANIHTESRYAGTREQVWAALSDGGWDVVLSDFRTPFGSVLDLIAELRSNGADVPLIVISDTPNNDEAMLALKAGASDYVSADRLSLLPALLGRTLREAVAVSERRRAEVLLKLSELRYRRMVEAANEGVVAVDLGGCITYVNQRFADMVHQPAADILGTRLGHLLAIRAGTHDHDALAERLLSDQVVRMECQVKRGDGPWGWALISSTPLGSDDAGPATHLLMVMETTEQRVLQAQLTISDRMAAVGMLAAGVVHEINNPLAVTLANLDLISRDVDLLESEFPGEITDALKEEAEDALVAARRVSAIVKDLRLFSHAESSVVAPIDVHPVLDSCCRMANNEVRHRARLTKEYSKVPLVEANEARLSQVVLNLLINAAQAIPGGNAATARITVATGVAPDGRVEIAVRDTGVGMSPRELRQLFTPFYTTKPAGVGTGLGLMISQRLVHEFGGEIAVSSEVGVGSEFRVLLPPSPSASLPAPGLDTRSAAPIARHRLLVIDDEPTIRTTIHRALSEYHDVILASSASQALAELQAHAFDAVLSDVMMPEMSGIELCKIVIDKYPELTHRFAFLTGGVLNPALVAFLEQDPHRLALEKPFTVRTLQTFVEQLLEGSGPDAAP